MALIPTPGGSTSNSYATVDDFDTYAESRLPVQVVSATDDQKEAALLAAARSLDENFDWTGSATDPASDNPALHQAMVWPRTGMLSRNKFSIASTVIPIELKNAQCEMAYQLLAGVDLVNDDAAAKANVAGVKAGSVSVDFQRTFTNTTEAVDLILRRLTSEFAYLSNAVPGEVRRLLVSSWYNEPTIIRPVMFGAM